MSTEPASSSRDSVPAEETPVPRRRRWPVIVLATAVALIVLLAIAPQLIAVSPLRSDALAAAFPDFPGRIYAGQASLGWLSPIEFREVEFFQPGGQRLLTIKRLEGRRPLWLFLSDTRRPGRFVVHSPQLELATLALPVASDDVESPEAEKPPRPELPVELDIELHDARFAMVDAAGAPRWTLGPFQAEVGIREQPSDHTPEVLVAESQLVDQLEISPDICNELLAFAAPLMAGVLRADGRFSLHVDDGSLLLHDPPTGKIAGQLTVHRAELAGGSILAQLSEGFGLPTGVRVVEQSEIHFHTDGQRVYHDRFALAIGKLEIRTSGWVGLDRTLDMMVEISLPEFDIERELLQQAFSGRTFQIPIKGTLNEPRPAATAIAGGGVELLGQILGGLSTEGTIGADVLESLEQGELLDRWRELRQERLGDPERPRRRLLFPRRRGVIEESEEPL